MAAPGSRGDRPHGTQLTPGQSSGPRSRGNLQARQDCREPARLMGAVALVTRDEARCCAGDVADEDAYRSRCLLSRYFRSRAGPLPISRGEAAAASA
jgi:hypothetical protein